MEINFKKVHTGKDLTISSIILLAGIVLFFVSTGLGFFLTLCGIFMLVLYKGGYKADGNGPVLTKKSMDLCKSCKNPLLDFLCGKDVTPSVKRGNEGGCVRLDVFYNRKESLAYAMLYDFCNYKMEPVTEYVELKGDRAKALIEQLLNSGNPS